MNSSSIGSNIRKENLRVKLKDQSRSLVSAPAGESLLTKEEGEHGFIVET
jgi:hypothetical protein